MKLTIQMVAVSSSSLSAIGYHPETKILQVQFRDGFVYQFFNVPVEIVNELSNSNSKGSFFRLRIAESFYFQRKERINED